MKGAVLLCFFVSWMVSSNKVFGEEHRATRLGNPATRFADPLSTPEDLRARFRDARLKPDFAEVLHQWRWNGDIDDLFRAAATAEITEVAISVGTTLPFMSSRESGKPICLRNVLWAGKEPAPAYAFLFASKGRRYRCVTPKACSNFLVQDLGLEPLPGLALECAAPADWPLGRPLQVCLAVSNPGTGPLMNSTVRLPIPAGTTVSALSEGGVASSDLVSWQISSLAPNAVQKLCASFTASTPGNLSFEASALGQSVNPAQSSCATKVFGISAILIDAIDLEDPVQVGSEVTYEIKVTNQGSTAGTNIRLLFNIPASEEYISGGGATPVRVSSGVVETEPLPNLASKAVAVWRVIVKAKEAGDVRFKIELTSDQFTRPIHEEESTLLY